MIPPVLRHIRFEENSATPDYLQLAREIEHLIRSGKLKEGQRLPSTAEMVSHWGINIKRVQRAMGVLSSTGLLQRFPKRGTFVSTKEHRPVIGILIGPDLLPEGHQFNRLLAAALESRILEKGLNLRIYDSLNHPNSSKWKRSHDELAYDLRHRSFSAFLLLNIFMGENALEETVLLNVTKKHLNVSFGAPRKELEFHIDYYDFAKVSALKLAKGGCKKIAYFPPQLLASYTSYKGHLEGFKDALLSSGLKAPEHAILTQQSNPISTPFPNAERIAYANMERILREWKRKNYYPDGIILSDDIDARGIIASIETHLERGQKPPEIVVLAMKESEHFYVLPAFRYSISGGEIAVAMMERLSQKMLGESTRVEPEKIKGEWINSFR